VAARRWSSKVCTRWNSRSLGYACEAVGSVTHQSDSPRQLIAEVVLGDKLPKPPKDVPLLPDEAARGSLTVRQLVEKHTSDARCASCHVRIDPFGFALENFDAIGRKLDRDLGDRPIDTHAKVLDGSEFDGIDGLRKYLLTTRRDDFLKQFCKKLLGYSLGRGVQLSDVPLLEEMRQNLEKNDFRCMCRADLQPSIP
jgi:hypothetical protein